MWKYLLDAIFLPFHVPQKLQLVKNRFTEKRTLFETLEVWYIEETTQVQVRNSTKISIKNFFLTLYYNL